MTEREKLVTVRDAAKAAWYTFLDECWFGTKEQKEANLSSPDRYRELREAHEIAQKKLDEWNPS